MGLHLIRKRIIRIQQLLLGESRVMDKLAEAALVPFIVMLKWKRGSVYNYKSFLCYCLFHYYAALP